MESFKLVVPKILFKTSAELEIIYMVFRGKFDSAPFFLASQK